MGFLRMPLLGRRGKMVILQTSEEKGRGDGKKKVFICGQRA